MASPGANRTGDANANMPVDPPAVTSAFTEELLPSERRGLVILGQRGWLYYTLWINEVEPGADRGGLQTGEYNNKLARLIFVG